MSLRMIKRYFVRGLGEKNYERIRSLADYFLSYTNSTYSQFGEDLILRRLFMGKRNGFFVDIGAFHPRQYSNTYWLYKNLGWSGINVEPRPGSVKLFNKLRPRDKNLEIAVGSSEGVLRLYSWGMNPGNTCAPDQARAMQAEFGAPRQIIEIKTVTLRAVFEEFLPPAQQIDLLSVDVEGHDLDVLQSNDWNRYRPQVVLVELFANTVEEITASELHRLMTQNGYTLRHVINPTLVYA